MGGGRIKEVLHIEKRKAVCDLYRDLIALTKRELEERARGMILKHLFFTIFAFLD